MYLSRPLPTIFLIIQTLLSAQGVSATYSFIYPPPTPDNSTITINTPDKISVSYNVSDTQDHSPLLSVGCWRGPALNKTHFWESSPILVKNLTNIPSLPETTPTTAADGLMTLNVNFTAMGLTSYRWCLFGLRNAPAPGHRSVPGTAAHSVDNDTLGRREWDIYRVVSGAVEFDFDDEKTPEVWTEERPAPKTGEEGSGVGRSGVAMGCGALAGMVWTAMMVL